MGAPVRTCLGCRTREPATSLLRIVWDEAAQEVAVDVRRRLPGRGAWLHPRRGCLEMALRRRAIGRALRRTVTPAATAGLEDRFTGAAARVPVGPAGA